MSDEAPTTPVIRQKPLPDWPRGMSEPLAAAYVGLSVSSFRSEVKAGRAPQPSFITRRRKVWLKDSLDGYLDRLFGLPSDAADGSAWMDRLHGEDEDQLRSGRPV